MDWSQILTASGAIGALGLALATWLRTRPAMKLAQAQADGPLWARIEKLEARLADVEHDLMNETWNFDLFLAQAETNPDKIFELIPRIREERRLHKERVAKKRGAREGQVIAAAREAG
jgi:hypothetical protein